MGVCVWHSRSLVLIHTLMYVAAAAAKSLQSCPTLCNPIDGSPPGSPVPGILQARTLVGCHFLLQCMTVKSESEVTQSCPTQQPHGLQPTRLHPWDFPGKSTGVDCHCLLQSSTIEQLKKASRLKCAMLKPVTLLESWSEVSESHSVPSDCLPL